MDKQYRCKLDEEMTTQGRTNKWLAKTVEATEQAVSNWRGGAIPSDRFKVKISNALGKSVGYLFFNEAVTCNVNENTA